jgi:acyl-coenzyme A thioesterase PaaI-like protein
MPRMAFLELPHTPGCVACGPLNPHGLRLSLFVDPADGTVRTEFTPRPANIGFEGVLHGGVLATVFDEAMVWAATWQGKRFCVCGEMTVRFRHEARIGKPLTIEAHITNPRPRLIQTSATAHDADGNLIAEATGKYVPMPAERHAEMADSFLPDPASEMTASALRESK